MTKKRRIEQGWLNINEGSAYAGVSRDTFRIWLDEGLSHIRKGNIVRMKREDIDAFLEKFRYVNKLDELAKKIARDFR